ncbi:MAG: hypothetical protein U5K74_02140 [Gemmatimonadaceae bacterium]|nr:hypothetical protein [Gemmatimonadaceae bacterium]
MSSTSTTPVTRLSALRLMSFIPPARDAVHVGLLSLDAQQVIDLAPLGISDALEALEQLEMLQRAAGAIVHGASRVAFDIQSVHLVAPIPLARSVVHDPVTGAVQFFDPTTLHGPGSSLTRADAAAARGGLAAVVGATLDAGTVCSDAQIDAALAGSLIVLGWPQVGHDGAAAVTPGALGPFLAVPRRSPESVIVNRVAPLSVVPAPDVQLLLPAPDAAAFRGAARAALETHTLRPGDLLTIFPQVPAVSDGQPMPAGSWVRVSAPGLGTLSLAVR